MNLEKRAALIGSGVLWFSGAGRRRIDKRHDQLTPEG